MDAWPIKTDARGESHLPGQETAQAWPESRSTHLEEAEWEPRSTWQVDLGSKSRWEFRSTHPANQPQRPVQQEASVQVGAQVYPPGKPPPWRTLFKLEPKLTQLVYLGFKSRREPRSTQRTSATENIKFNPEPRSTHLVGLGSGVGSVQHLPPQHKHLIHP